MTQVGLARDKTVALSGVTQPAIGLNGNRQFLVIDNTSGAAAVGVNYSGPASGGTGPGGVGNDATIGSTGTEVVAAGEKRMFDHWVPQNPLNVRGTSTQSVVIIEG